MHRASAQPIGQSVRGGTQTSGQLFLRNEPEITMLTDALAVAIRNLSATFPPPILATRCSSTATWEWRSARAGRYA
jgi:hypothetical protein